MFNTLCEGCYVLFFSLLSCFPVLCHFLLPSAIHDFPPSLTNGCFNYCLSTLCELIVPHGATSLLCNERAHMHAHKKPNSSVNIVQIPSVPLYCGFRLHPRTYVFVLNLAQFNLIPIYTDHVPCCTCIGANGKQIVYLQFISILVIADD